MRKQNYMEKVSSKIKEKMGGSKLIIVSNREPYIHEKRGGRIACRKALGGLAPTLDGVLKLTRGAWIAWGGGNADFEVLDGEGNIRVPENDPKYLLKRVKLSKKEVKDYYLNFSNRVLWPLFNYSIENTSFEHRFWRMYQDVNRKFAKKVSEVAGEEDYVWMQDYHLALVPKYLRDENEKRKLAFFWHIPWPPWEVFSTLPWRREILEGLLDCDLVGFHTNDYAENFLRCVEKGMGLRVDRNAGVVRYKGRKVCVKEFPLGVDYGTISKGAQEKGVLGQVEKIRRKFRGSKIIIGVDRLDYTKGLKNKLLAFERIIRDNPSLRGKVVLVQVASPSRNQVTEYRQLKREVDELVGRINGRYHRFEWLPVFYFCRMVSQKELLAYYRAADVGLVTPFVDGMNLVSKEYIAARGEKAGKLVLSEFAGASDDLKGAVKINPYDIDGIGKGIMQALEMEEGDAVARFNQMKNNTRNRNIYWWLGKFCDRWGKLYE